MLIPIQRKGQTIAAIIVYKMHKCNMHTYKTDWLQWTEAWLCISLTLGWCPLKK